MQKIFVEVVAVNDDGVFYAWVRDATTSARGSMRRSRMEIIFEILKNVEDGIGAKTRLMYASNLDWRNFSRYISFLEEKGFVVCSGDSYKLTEKGKLLLQKMREVAELFSSQAD